MSWDDFAVAPDTAPRLRVLVCQYDAVCDTLSLSS